MPAPARTPSHATGESFRSLFEAELSYVLRTLRRLGVVDRDVEDVAQEVFVTVHDRFADYDPERPIRPWLFSFCWRTAANHRRLARHRTQLDGPRIDERGDGKGADPHTDAVRRERRELLMEALGHVPFERRVVLIMHDIDGVAAPDVAVTLEIPVNTVYSRLRVARRELERAVARLRKGGEA